MQLWTRDGRYPTPLPAQDVDNGGRVWTDLANNADGRAACGWIQAPLQPDHDPETEQLVWDDDDWTVVDRPPPPPPPPAEPIRVTKADFQRRLQPAERYAINALRREIAGLTPADYQDPQHQLLIAAEDVLIAFEQPAEFIELDHPDTFAGLSLFAFIGVLTEARVTEILTP